MPTRAKLLRRRILSNIRFQYRVWRMAVDWTVALYIVTPALFFAGYQYALWWRDRPFWLDFIPYTAMTGLFYLFALAGTIRYYIEEADQLFLYQRKSWFGYLMAGGLAYSLAMHAVKLVFAAAAVAPLAIKGYGISAAQYAGFVGTVCLFKFHLLLIKQVLDMKIAGWRVVLLRIVLIPAGGILLGALALLSQKGLAVSLLMWALLAAPLFLAIPSRLRLKGTFHHDIRREQTEKMKVAAVLLGDFIQKKPKLLRKKPLLFSRSNRLFVKRTQENVLAESVVKAAFRSPAKFKLYLNAVLVYAGVIVVIPGGPLRLLFWVLSAPILAYMAKIFAKEVSSESFIKLFHWKDGVRYGAFFKATAGIMLPGFLLLTLMTGCLELPWWQGFLLLPAGIALGIFSSKVASLWGV